MVEEVIMALAKSGLILYAFIGFLVFILAPYVFKWMVMLHNEKREDILRAEQIAREETAKAKARELKRREALAYKQSLPSWCSACKGNTMVKTDEMYDDTFEYRRYTCPKCGNIKDIPVDK